MEAAPPPPAPAPAAAEATAESIPNPAATPPSKGFGLKKWRRIRRGDSGTDPAGSADISQIHKRRLSLPEPIKSRELHGGRDGDGDSSLCITPDIASTEAVVTGFSADAELVHLVAGSGFSVGADSDNSEDRSSKSSTAASAPRGRGKGWGAGLAAQQRGRGRGGGADAIKKFRGDRVSKENSQSSMESDLRSSNVGFGRWGGSNGKRSEVSVNDDGENSDEAQTCEDYKENGRVGGGEREEFDEDLREEESVRKSGSGRHRTELDPFLESIVLLQAAQEALETEIQKFGEIGKEATLADTNGLLERTEGSNSPALERHFLELDQKIKQLERKLEEASATIKLKESRVLELESILDKTYLLKKETDSSGVPTLEENRIKMELELEGLLKKRIEAEVEYLITSGATVSWKVQTEDQIAFLEEQKSLVNDHAQMILKLTEAENKATALKEHAEELEARCKDLLGTVEVLKLQSKVCRSSVCCFTQLVMLSIGLWWFLAYLLPPSEGTIPT